MMPRRSLLTATERENLLGWPQAQAELIPHYTLIATDLAIIRQHRGAANRLGYDVQLCSMLYPCVALETGEEPFFLYWRPSQLSSKYRLKAGASMGIARRHGGSMHSNYSTLRLQSVHNAALSRGSSESRGSGLADRQRDRAGVRPPRRIPSTACTDFLRRLQGETRRRLQPSLSNGKRIPIAYRIKLP
jgi:hypothetical protein